MKTEYNAYQEIRKQLAAEIDHLDLTTVSASEKRIEAISLLISEEGLEGPNYIKGKSRFDELRTK